MKNRKPKKAPRKTKLDDDKLMDTDRAYGAGPRGSTYEDDMDTGGRVADTAAAAHQSGARRNRSVESLDRE